MNRTELLNTWEKGDLITLDHRDEIHYVWDDRKAGDTRICRPSMLEVGTHSRDQREWIIVKRGVSFKDYVKTVRELRGNVCGHCRNWGPKER